MRSLLALITTLAIVACDKAPEKTASQLRMEIHAAAEAAELSVKNSDKPAAEAAASNAAAALDQLRKLHSQTAKPSESPVDDALLVECETEARKVGQWATLTKEKVGRAEKLAGWKAKTYYAIETATYKIIFHGLALAASQAADGNLARLPQSVQDGAREAAKFVEAYVGPQRLPSGELDWQGVSRELKKYAETPPPSMRLFIAAVMMLAMDFDLAFYEIESLSETTVESLEWRTWYHILRGVAYMGQGYGQLALAEFELADSLSTKQQLNLDPAAKCGLHLILTFYFLHEKRWSDADRCLASANRAWPDNPVVVYLTGERQIASNNYAAADESFSKALQGTDYEWLADRVSARVKRLRDNPASLEPVLFDFNLMTDLASSFIKNQSQKSETLKGLRERMDATQSYIQELKQKMPKVEMKMPDMKNLFKGSAEPAETKK